MQVMCYAIMNIYWGGGGGGGDLLTLSYRYIVDENTEDVRVFKPSMVFQFANVYCHY